MPDPHNANTVQFYEHIEQRCAAIAALPASQHDAAIAALSRETETRCVLSGNTLRPIVERYAYQRLPDWSQLARQFIDRLGRPTVQAMLATNHGLRSLKQHVQAALNDEIGLSVTGPRVSALVDAIETEIWSPSFIAAQQHDR